MPWWFESLLFAKSEQDTSYHSKENIAFSPVPNPKHVSTFAHSRIIMMHRYHEPSFLADRGL